MGAVLNEHAWAAGIIDGEGYITVRITRTSYSLMVRVAMTSELTINRMQALFGGQVRSEARRKEVKRVYVWSVNGAAAVRVLDLILPHLVTKRREAEMARAFAGLPKAPGRLSPLLKLVRRSLYIGLRHLKL